MQWVTVEVCRDVGSKDVFGNVSSIVPSPLAEIKEGGRVKFFRWGFGELGMEFSS